MPHDWTPLIVLASRQPAGRPGPARLRDGLSLAGRRRARASSPSPIASARDRLARLWRDDSSLADALGALLIAAALVLIRLPDAGAPACIQAAQDHFERAMVEPAPTMNLDELRAALAPRLAAQCGVRRLGRRGARHGGGGARRAGRPRAARLSGRRAGDDRRLVRRDRPGMAAAFPPERIAAMKIRERIAAPGPVPARADRAAPGGVAPRARHPRLAAKLRARRPARLAQPPTGCGGSPATRATDFNHYSKRAMLIGVYGSTSLVFSTTTARALPTPAPSSTAASTT